MMLTLVFLSCSTSDTTVIVLLMLTLSFYILLLSRIADDVDVGFSVIYTTVFAYCCLFCILLFSRIADDVDVVFYILLISRIDDDVDVVIFSTASVAVAAPPGERRHQADIDRLVQPPRQQRREEPLGPAAVPIEGDQQVQRGRRHGGLQQDALRRGRAPRPRRECAQRFRNRE